MSVKTNTLTDSDLLAKLLETAKDETNLLDVVARLDPGEAFKDKLFTVKEFVTFVANEHKRVISDATVRALLVSKKIDGIYSKSSTNLKYLVLMTDRSKSYIPRKYKRSKNVNSN